MKNCKEIENNLSLYLDDSLSGADKQAVEEH
jgi:anti-sigma factor RsiW